MRLDAAAHPEFSVDVLDVRSDRLRADHEETCDLGVGEPAREQFERLELAWGQQGSWLMPFVAAARERTLTRPGTQLIGSRTA